MDASRHEQSARAGKLVSLDAPPIDWLPTWETGRPTDVSDPPALDRFVASAVRWDAVRVTLSVRVTSALWVLLVVDLVVCTWLFAVLRGWAGCEGPLCSAATLGGHPAITFVLATVGVAGLLAMSVPTRGLTRGAGSELVVLSMAAVVALVSVIGAVLVVLMLAIIAALVFTVLVAVLLAVLSNS